MGIGVLQESARFLGRGQRADAVDKRASQKLFIAAEFRRRRLHFAELVGHELIDLVVGRKLGKRPLRLVRRNDLAGFDDSRVDGHNGRVAGGDVRYETGFVDRRHRVVVAGEDRHAGYIFSRAVGETRDDAQRLGGRGRQAKLLRLHFHPQQLGILLAIIRSASGDPVLQQVVLPRAGFHAPAAAVFFLIGRLAQGQALRRVFHVNARPIAFVAC